MVWTYRAEFVPPPAGLCLNPRYFIEHQSLGYQLLPPRAPQIRSIPLSPDTRAMETRSLFPLAITADLSHVTSLLSTFKIPSSTTIHIHDTTAHIGDIRAYPGAQTAFEIVHFVQRTACGPLDLETYQSLSLRTKAAIEDAFVRRMTQTIGPRVAHQLWSLFMGGHDHPSGPCGADLLLGNTNIWSLDAVPGSGMCCLHVA
ncbi:hypothetical protein BDZ94DRAFT_1266621 [Collybia nuda]|uniref:Uncharacterized protein n=1 Tax=Collybia nuda TaxID=64659 RepID=A0A9P5Y2N0_9AGAR|nr:hypothetical protein BDZ94DRAFT_1266621 [Collybia nuda]